MMQSYHTYYHQNQEVSHCTSRTHPQNTTILNEPLCERYNLTPVSPSKLIRLMALKCQRLKAWQPMCVCECQSLNGWRQEKQYVH